MCDFLHCFSGLGLGHTLLEAFWLALWCLCLWFDSSAVFTMVPSEDV